ncbi:TALPID3 protein-like [Polyodon spathula]|uniref:TALPID3 protein-like n=1 Tax=Polyodon spathula TaxID=7913 RepID=UPI001B7E01BB|nr:TALPID3 protein-like [Polyodon spathula]
MDNVDRSQANCSTPSIVTAGRESMESSLTSNAGDILIRSTSLHHARNTSADNDHDVSNVSSGFVCYNKKVKFSVKKLREVGSPYHTNEYKKQAENNAPDQMFIPPALPANKPAHSADDRRESVRDADSLIPAWNTTKRQPLHGHENSPGSMSHQVPEKDAQERGVRGTFLKNPPDGSRKEGSDIVISQYSVGRKEAMKAVFKQRSKTGPVRKEVKVQFLENQSSAKKEPTVAESRPSFHCAADPSITAAAATAAAIAVTAPLLKGQSDLEAKICDLVKNLQETDLLVQREQHQHSKRPFQDERVVELEKQLNTLTEQRLNHLEKLQQQQLEMQSRLMSSTINAVGLTSAYSHTVHHGSAATSQPGLQQLPSNHSQDSHLGSQHSASLTAAAAYPSQHIRHGAAVQKSPLDTPAPRRFAPVPMSRDGKVQHRNDKPAVEKTVSGSVSSTRLGNRRLLEEILNEESAEGSRVTMATAGRYPERSSSGNLLTESFPAFEPPSRGSGRAEVAASTAVQKATDVLHNLGRLKNEMQGLLQEGQQWKPSVQHHSKLHDTFTMGWSVQARQNKSHKAIDPTPLQQPLLAGAAPPMDIADLPQLPQPCFLQKSKAPTSMFEDAERILRQVKNNKKVLEENLEAIMRAKDGAALHSQIEALSTNRDATQETRIKKTVDAWIGVLSEDIPNEIARKDVLSQMKVKEKEAVTVSSQKGRGAKDMKLHRDVKNKTQSKLVTQSSVKPFQNIVGEPSERSGVKSRPVTLQRKEKAAKVPLVMQKSVMEDEDYLSRVYGKALYQGHRNSLKKGPYLRLNSASPKSKPQRPKMVESVKGIKMKSARTQTSPFPLKLAVTRPIKQRPISIPLLPENQYMFSPSGKEPLSAMIDGPVEGHLIPMAIPLGEPRMDGMAPQPRGVIITSQHPVTVTTSIPPSPSKQKTQVKKPTVAVIEMRSEQKDPPKLSVQTPEQAHTEVEDIAGFPGTDFIAVNDITQESEKDELPESVIELNGCARPIFAPYHGPAFPPTVPPPLPTVDITEERIREQETLEKRLVEWVEQELLSRVINEMYPLHLQPRQDILVSDNEDSISSTSDIVEAAGGGGLQLFVDAGLPVDSDLIRQYVNDALAEIIANMLGEREEQSQAQAPPLPLSRPSSLELVIPTPVPTPQHTPRQSPSLPVSTPDISELESAAESVEPEPKPEPLPLADPDQEVVKSPVETPAATPIPSPPRVATPSPPISERIQTPSPQPAKLPSNPWGDAELPLEEEDPRSEREDLQSQRAVVMSVAKEEEAESLVMPSPPVTPRIPTPPPQAQTPTVPFQTPPPATVSTEESSSSISVSETETADRIISEGELLFSYGQMIATRALAEGGVILPNLNASQSSSLYDAQEMDYDPPSEGQVIRRPHVHHHRDPVLSLLAKMNQGPIAPQEVRYHPQLNSDEDSSSMGEMSEGQRPRLTAAGETILTGHSLFLDQSSLNGLMSNQGEGHPSSPGQFSKEPGRAPGGVEETHGPMSFRELEDIPRPLPQTLRVTQIQNGEQVFEIPRNERRASPIQVRPYENVTEEARETGMEAGSSSRPNDALLKMAVMLPSMQEEDQSGSISMLEGDTDTSGADVF